VRLAGLALVAILATANACGIDANVTAVAESAEESPGGRSRLMVVHVVIPRRNVHHPLFRDDPCPGQLALETLEGRVDLKGHPIQSFPNVKVRNESGDLVKVERLINEAEADRALNSCQHLTTAIMLVPLSGTYTIEFAGRTWASVSSGDLDKSAGAIVFVPRASEYALLQLDDNGQLMVPHPS
jgi:hypothetical protein